MAAFEICEIFSNYYFSYLRDYKATLAGGNKIFIIKKWHTSSEMLSFPPRWEIIVGSVNLIHKIESYYHHDGE